MSILALQMFVASSFEILFDMHEDILTKQGQLICFLALLFLAWSEGIVVFYMNVSLVICSYEDEVCRRLCGFAGEVLFGRHCNALPGWLRLRM